MGSRPRGCPEMVPAVLVIVGVVALTECCGAFPVRQQRLLGLDQVLESYYTGSNKNGENEELNVVSQIQRVDLNKIKYSHIYDINGETYIMLKASRHRNKRYTSYLTLCPFKICNMGHKRTRTRRYMAAVNDAQDNEAT